MVSFWEKFKAIAIMVAPTALQAAGLPAALGTAVVSGITAGQQMVGATNDVRAAQAATIASTTISGINSVLVDKGHMPLVDETVSNDALAQALKLTYDMTKMLHTANGDPMPTPATV